MDFSTPSSPTVVSSFVFPYENISSDYNYRIQGVGKLLFAIPTSHPNAKIYVFDISSPGNLSQVGVINDMGSLLMFDKHSNYRYVHLYSRSNMQYRVYDVINPSSPEYKGNYGYLPSNFEIDMASVGNKYAILARTNGNRALGDLIVYDVSDRLKIKNVAMYSDVQTPAIADGGSINRTATINNYIYIMTNNKFIIDELVAN